MSMRELNQEFFGRRSEGVPDIGIILGATFGSMYGDDNTKKTCQEYLKRRKEMNAEGIEKYRMWRQNRW